MTVPTRVAIAGPISGAISINPTTTAGESKRGPAVATTALTSHQDVRPDLRCHPVGVGGGFLAGDPGAVSGLLLVKFVPLRERLEPVRDDRFYLYHHRVGVALDPYLSEPVKDLLDRCRGEREGDDCGVVAPAGLVLPGVIDVFLVEHAENRSRLPVGTITCTSHTRDGVARRTSGGFDRN